MQLIVEKNNIRLDKYLSEATEITRSQINKMIDSAAVLVNDQKVKPSYLVKEGDVIVISDNWQQPIAIKPNEMPITIVYEDEDIMVVNKPSGVVVHPGAGNHDHTLVNGLMYYTQSLSDINGEERPGIVHRIDKDTSGLLLIAKSNQAHAILTEYFKNKEVHREYIALLDGVFPHNTATIDAPIGRDKKNRKKMCVTAENAKSAITHLQVIKRFAHHTLVSLVLDTGRTHQIRVHMQYIGYPVHNDPVYNNRQATPFGQFLHSHSMDFYHPITKEHLTFSCPLPTEFQEYLDQLEQEEK